MQTAPEISDQRSIPEQAKPNIAGTVDLFAKAAAVALSALYILGFCVVSFYLATYGLHSVALLRVQYLAAGFFSLSPLCAAYLVAALLHLQFRNFSLSPFPASFWSRARWFTLALVRLAWDVVKVFLVASLIIDGIASIFVSGIRDLLWQHPWICVR